MNDLYYGVKTADLSKANKLDISHKVVDMVNNEFKTDMTYAEIYDTIF